MRAALPTLATLIQSDNTEILTDACWALSCLSEGVNAKIQAVLETEGVLPQLLALLSNESARVATPALRCVGNIVSGDNTQTQAALDAGVLAALAPLLVHAKASIRMEACWSISNITAGSKAQIQAVFDAGLVPKLAQMLKDEEFDVQKEVTWCISNIASGGSADHIRELVRCNTIEPLAAMLRCEDARVRDVAKKGCDLVIKAAEQSTGSQQHRFAWESAWPTSFSRRSLSALLSLEPAQMAAPAAAAVASQIADFSAAAAAYGAPPNAFAGLFAAPLAAAPARVPVPPTAEELMTAGMMVSQMLDVEFERAMEFVAAAGGSADAAVEAYWNLL